MATRSPSCPPSPAADNRPDVPDLSVLMSAYNEEATIARAIERVLDADYPVDDVELVLVQNGSTDRTAEVLSHRSWPESVRIVHVEENRGKGAGIRTALG